MEKRYFRGAKGDTYWPHDAKHFECYTRKSRLDESNTERSSGHRS